MTRSNADIRAYYEREKSRSCRSVGDIVGERPSSLGAMLGSIERDVQLAESKAFDATMRAFSLTRQELQSILAE